MMDRDKALKLELDVVNSLHNDMTLRLAMSQRTIKALNEKVAAMEATNAAIQQSHEAKLREKVNCLLSSIFTHCLTPSLFNAGGGDDPARGPAKQPEQARSFRELQNCKCHPAYASLALLTFAVILCSTYRTTCGASWPSPSPSSAPLRTGSRPDAATNPKAKAKHRQQQILRPNWPVGLAMW